tara:strand:- start:310 stop:465 length:156 start_codon:yes stop_codon:yes gene_type:complete
MTNFVENIPFILLAKIKVKEDKVSEYLELADKTVETSGHIYEGTIINRCIS